MKQRKLLVLGATGATGRWLVQMAIERGQRVTALVRSKTSIQERDGREIVQGDVLDADALTVLADDPSALVGREERSVIITPHPGEMARLVGASVDEVQTNRIQVAADFAATRRLYVVLKGNRRSGLT